jgi:hypothetical protein
MPTLLNKSEYLGGVVEKGTQGVQGLDTNERP